MDYRSGFFGCQYCNEKPEIHRQSFRNYVKVGRMNEILLTLYIGAYAEYIAVSTHMLLHKPEHLSWEEAAGIPEVYRPPHGPSRSRYLL